MATAKKKKKRRSQAPVALVYFITIIIFMALLLMLSIYLLKYFHIIQNETDEEQVVSNHTYNDLLGRINSKNVLTEMTLIRIDPENESMIVVPIPSWTVLKGDSSRTLRDVYESEGMDGVARNVEKTYGITIDNYIGMSNEAFEKVADVCGGMTYTSTEELYYLSQENDENDISIAKGELVNLSGRQIRLLTQYPVFASGKQGNVEFLGEAVEALINNAFQQPKIITDNLDNIYNIMTSNSDTDFSQDEWKLQKSYLKTMLASGIVPATRMIPVGVWSDSERFTVSDTFVEELKKAMSEPVVKEETPVSEGSEGTESPAA
ncbi:MAG: LCP family protein [Ruminococcus sp.]|nr:LCP family protein [Ruminococcus sp.]